MHRLQINNNTDYSVELRLVGGLVFDLQCKIAAKTRLPLTKTHIKFIYTFSEVSQHYYQFFMI